MSTVVLAVSVAAAATQPSAWHFRRRIPLTPGDALAVVKLDRAVCTRARADLADLRVLRDGEEVPYILESLGASARSEEQRAQILDQAVAPGLGLQFTLRLGDRFQHNRVRLETAERNFRQTVRIETSDDGKHWAIARADGAIFDFSQGERRLSSLSVAYPLSTRTFLRVTVRGWTKVQAVTAAYVAVYQQRSAEREVLATLTPRVAQDLKEQTTILTLDAGVESLPVDRIRILTSSPSFHRAVEVEVSADGKDWGYLTQGVIARLPGEESLVIRVPETRRRHLRLRVYNRDDQPLVIGNVELEGLIRRVKFLAPVAGTYWLYWGNPDARTPVYDLPILLSRRDHLEEKPWAAAAVEVNPDYHPPPGPVQPWSERYPAILYTVLGGAVLALGAATLRFALRMRRPGEG